jgi:hypothetical protein
MQTWLCRVLLALFRVVKLRGLNFFVLGGWGILAVGSRVDRVWIHVNLHERRPNSNHNKMASCGRLSQLNNHYHNSLLRWCTVMEADDETDG